MPVEVVVTGMGVVSPIGTSVEDFGHALFSGCTGVDPIERFDASGLATRFAAEVKDWHSDYRDIKISFALAAVAEALGQAFGREPLLNNYRSSLHIGIGLELFSMDDLVAAQEAGFDACPDHMGRDFLNTPSDICAHIIGQRYRFTQAPRVHISACAAATDAIGSAFEAVRAGSVDIAVGGGTDSMINPMGVAGFSRIGALSQRNASPQTASRPFDKSRDGFVLGEGAGFLVLESLIHARRRGASPLAVISGYGNSLDAYSVSDPHPEGDGALRAMQSALDSASLAATELSAINCHGTGTPKNDSAETKAIRRLLGEKVNNVPVHASKSLFGHLISAAGAVETIASILCLREQRLHHTINLHDIDEACELCHIRGEPRSMPLRHILKNSFAFGGHNACLVISAF